MRPAPICRRLSLRPKRKRDVGAFTLVELLIVVAMIAILIAMLLPALRKARESARRVVCLSNGHQLYLSMLMYGDENKGRLPLGSTRTFAPSNPFPAPDQMSGSMIKRLERSYGVLRTSWFCPANKPIHYDPSLTGGNPNVWGSRKWIFPLGSWVRSDGGPHTTEADALSSPYGGIMWIGWFYYGPYVEPIDTFAPVEDFNDRSGQPILNDRLTWWAGNWGEPRGWHTNHAPYRGTFEELFINTIYLDGSGKGLSGTGAEPQPPTADHPPFKFFLSRRPDFPSPYLFRAPYRGED